MGDALDDIARLATRTAGIFNKDSAVPADKAGFFEGLPQAAAEERAQEPQDEDSEEQWPHDKLLRWLREQGGLSEDCLESVAAAKLEGQLFATASEDDWRNEELGLEDEDVAQVLLLQQKF